jgi:hypothetical protein
LILSLTESADAAFGNSMTAELGPTFLPQRCGRAFQSLPG